MSAAGPLKRSAAVKQIVIFGLIVFLSGCGALKTKNYAPPVFVQLTDEYLETFIGKDISTAQKMFGYRYTTNQIDDHRKAYIWEMDRQMGTLITHNKTVHCNWSLITDPTGKVLDSQRTGYCPAAIKIH